MKQKINDNKILIILFAIVVICVVIIGISLIKYFFLGGSNNYGDRLSEIDKHPLSANAGGKIVDLYAEDANVGDIKFELRGKIIYVIIDFKQAVKLSKAKSTAAKSLTTFTDDEKSYYDIQYTLTGTTLIDNTTFPIMGYKSKTSSEIVWTNN